VRLDGVAEPGWERADATSSPRPDATVSPCQVPTDLAPKAGPAPPSGRLALARTGQSGADNIARHGRDVLASGQTAYPIDVVMARMGTTVVEEGR
jgi:hypothetical protein